MQIGRSKTEARKTGLWRENGRKREKRQKICNENERRREVSSERGSREESGRCEDKKRAVESKKEKRGRKR